MKRVGRLEWINPSKPFEGVRFVPDEVGWFMMSEEPEMDRNGSPILNLYNVATDSYDQDEAVESTSKGACWVWKRFYDAGRTYKKWVAGIIERPTPEQGGAEKFYEHTAMMCIFYNMSLNLVEYSKILILSWYKNNGLESLLKARPDIATAAMMVNSNAKTNMVLILQQKHIGYLHYEILLLKKLLIKWTLKNKLMPLFVSSMCPEEISGNSTAI